VTDQYDTCHRQGRRAQCFVAPTLLSPESNRTDTAPHCGYVARNNTSFRLQEILSLLETAVLNVVAEKWPHCVQHAVRDDDLLWELDGPNDNGVQRFAVTESSFQRR
jgi:hypothetical protein